MQSVSVIVMVIHYLKVYAKYTPDQNDMEFLKLLISVSMCVQIPYSSMSQSFALAIDEATPLYYLTYLLRMYYLEPIQIWRSRPTSYAAKMSDGSVETWGVPFSGGDSSSVRTELDRQPVDTIYSTIGAFAAKMADGSVVTWGAAGWGGDSNSVSAELKWQAVDTIYLSLIHI